MSREAWHKRSVGQSSSPGKTRNRRWVNSHSEGKWWIRNVRREVGGPQKNSRRSPRRQRREQGFESPRGKSHDVWRDSDTGCGWSSSAWDSQSPKPNICRHFQAGHCTWGSSCYFSHEWPDSNVDLLPQKAGIRFRLDRDAVQVLRGPSWATPVSNTSTGPMRPRIVGSLEDLGRCEDGSWDPQLGLDMWWEGDCWTSTVISTEPDVDIDFSVVRLDQAESHPGLLQAWERVPWQSVGKAFLISIAVSSSRCCVPALVVVVLFNRPHAIDERHTHSALRSAFSKSSSLKNRSKQRGGQIQQKLLSCEDEAKTSGPVQS